MGNMVINEFNIREDGTLVGYYGLGGIVTLPSEVKKIGRRSFKDNGNIDTIVLNKELEDIQGCAFEDSSIKEYRIDSANEKYAAFDGMLFNKEMTELLQIPKYKEGVVTIPEGVTSVSNEAFSMLKKIQKIIIPASLTQISESSSVDPFEGCSALECIEVNKGNQAYYSEDGILYNKNKTQMISVPKSIHGTVTVLDGTTRLGSLVRNLENVEKIILPATLSYIEPSAFYDIWAPQGKLKEVVIDEKNNRYQSIDGAIYSKAGDILYFVPKGYEGEFKVLNTVKHITSDFADCDGITTITLSDAVDVFRGAIIPYKEPKNLRFNIYEDCNYLGSVNNPYYAFVSPCQEDAEIVKMHEDTKIILNNAFVRNKKIKKIILPKELIYNNLCNLPESEDIVLIEGALESIMNFKRYASLSMYSNYKEATMVLDFHDDPEKDVKLICVKRSHGEKSDNLESFNNTASDLADYDEAVYVNKGTLKMKAEARLLAMIYRLEKPYQLDDDFKGAYIEILTKNIKKVIQLANDRNEPEIIECLKQYGIIKDDAQIKKAMAAKEVKLGSAADLKKIWTTKKLDDGTFSLTQYKGNETVVEVPEYIGKTQVTVLEATFCAYKYNMSTMREIPKEYVEARKKIEKIILPSSIKEIRSASFACCEALKEINLPSNLQIIGWEAFRDCSSLKKIEIPKTVTNMGEDVFRGSGIESLVIPGSIREVSRESYSKLEKVVIEDGVEAVDSFQYSKNLKKVYISNSVKRIGAFAFNGCEGLTDLFVGDSVEAIGYSTMKTDPRNTFSGCDNLTIHTPVGSYMESIAIELGIKHDNVME